MHSTVSRSSREWSNTFGVLLAPQLPFVLEPELESRYVDPMGKYSRIGSIVLCLAAAGLSALAFRVSPYKSFLPLLFLAIIVFVAVRFGSTAGILGTIGAAAVFAEF